MLTPINPITNWSDRPARSQQLAQLHQTAQKSRQVEFYNRLYDCHVRHVSNLAADSSTIDQESCNTFALYG